MFHLKNKKSITLTALFLLALATSLLSSDTYAFRSAAEIDSNLPDARNLIVGTESYAQSKNYDCGLGKSISGQRSCLNGGGGVPYMTMIWISPRNSPSKGSTLNLPSTVKTLNLQLNSAFFLTAATSSKYTYSTAGLGTIVYSSATAPNMVTYGNYPDDRLPATGNPNTASLKAQRYKVYNAQVVSGGGYLSNVSIGSIFGAVTNSGSRYAFAPPVNFTYNTNEWTGSKNEVTVRFTVSNINTFHQTPPGGTSQCTSRYTGGIITVSSNDFDSCSKRNVDYKFTFYVTPVWDLIPSIKIDKATASEGETASISPYISNTAKGNSEDTYWSIAKMVYPGGVKPPDSLGTSKNGRDLVDAAKQCEYYNSTGATDCSNVAKESGAIFPPGETPLGDRDVIFGGGYPVGTNICYALSAYKKNNANVDPVENQVWAHSIPACAVVGKEPKVQVWGGDLSVRGLVNTSNVVKSGKTYGSWVEYGIFSVGTVDGLASGSALSSVPKDGVAGSNSCNRSYLTFANAVTTACSVGSPIGGFNNISSSPDVVASFPVIDGNGGTPTINAAILSDNSRSGLFKATSPLTLGSMNIPKGRWLVINASGADVNINGDINYEDPASDPFTDIDEIPQVIIIAKNIKIAGSVKNIDAWLIASDSINTCSEAPNGTQLTIAVCNQQLKVNGPVISNHLYLQRTAGSGTGADSNTPAEIFNLRPDAYLWAYNQSKTTNLIRTVYTTALPPRL